MHCDACPVCTEVGLQETVTEVTVGGEDDPPLPAPPPPQERAKAKETATRTEMTTRKLTGALVDRAFVSSDTVGLPRSGFLGAYPRQGSQTMARRVEGLSVSLCSARTNASDQYPFGKRIRLILTLYISPVKRHIVLITLVIRGLYFWV